MAALAPGCNPSQHRSDDAPGQTLATGDATPPTPPNVTWLRDHFRKARIRQERTDSNFTCPPAHDVVFTKVPIAAIVPRAPSPDLGYIRQLERTRSLQFLLCPTSGLGLRSAQQNLALCTVLLDGNDHYRTDMNQDGVNVRLRECLKLIIETARRRLTQQTNDSCCERIERTATHARRCTPPTDKVLRKETVHERSLRSRTGVRGATKSPAGPIT